jgi:hypothetical protein
LNLAAVPVASTAVPDDVPRKRETQPVAKLTRTICAPPVETYATLAASSTAIPLRPLKYADVPLAAVKVLVMDDTRPVAPPPTTHASAPCARLSAEGALKSTLLFTEPVVYTVPEEDRLLPKAIKPKPARPALVNPTA